MSSFYYNGVQPKCSMDFLRSLAQSTTLSQIKMRLEIQPQKLIIDDFHWMLVEIVNRCTADEFSAKTVDAFIQFISTESNAIVKTGSTGFIQRCYREIKYTNVTSNESMMLKLSILSKVLNVAAQNWLSINSENSIK